MYCNVQSFTRHYFAFSLSLQDEWNLYGAHPMYMNLEDDENANAVLLLNSNAMG